LAHLAQDRGQWVGGGGSREYGNESSDSIKVGIS
jgi:hypothetical protein